MSEPVRRVYFVAVAGTGMGSLAGMLKDRGLDVRGSDARLYPPMSTLLERWGIPVHVGFLFIGRNLSGKWCVGRYNRVEDKRDRMHLDFSNQDPSARDTHQGTLRFTFQVPELSDGTRW